MDNKKKEAEKRKRDGEILFQRLGMSLDSELFSTAILFDNLGKSQMNIDSFNNINYIFNNFAGVDVSIFTHDLDQPCIFVLAPILDIRFICSWTSPLIVTSNSTLQSALNSRSKNIYIYSYNSVEGWSHDPRVKLINSEVIKSFNLVEIIKFIVEDMKNEKV
jgi:hypothetical protein